MGERGFLTIGRWGRVHIRLHWTLPIGLLLFTGLQPGSAFAFVALLLCHEIGHAILVRRQRLTVTAIALHGFGAECQYLGRPTAIGRSVIAWGGVLAQAALLVGADVAVAYGGWPRDPFVRQVLDMLGAPNALLIALNLVPVGRLDGREAWMLFPRLWRRYYR